MHMGMAGVVVSIVSEFERDLLTAGAVGAEGAGCLFQARVDGLNGQSDGAHHEREAHNAAG